MKLLIDHIDLSSSVYFFVLFFNLTMVNILALTLSRRTWSPTQVFLPRDPMDIRAWQAIIHKVTKSNTTEVTEHSSQHILTIYLTHQSGEYQNIEDIYFGAQ